MEYDNNRNYTSKYNANNNYNPNNGYNQNNTHRYTYGPQVGYARSKMMNIPGPDLIQAVRGENT